MATLSMLFGLLTLVLACIGLYGLVASGVVHRTNEIGVRRALGAQPHEILWPIAKAGFALTLAGVLIGLGVAAGVNKLIEKARLLGLCPHRSLDLNALPIDVITAPTVRLDLLTDQHRLAETVRRQAPRLLLLDPFVRLHQVNENQAGEVDAILGYLRALQRAYNVAVIVVHHDRKNGSSTGGLSLRGSGDFFAWVDTALSLRRRQHTLILSVEHRAAAPPDPLTLALLGTEQDMHLGIVRAEELAPPATADLDAMILDALEHASSDGLERASLRAA